jgi:acetylornithine deacetylase/succinyl-diaminopimelate desuccinylase-like protein
LSNVIQVNKPLMGTLLIYLPSLLENTALIEIKKLVIYYHNQKVLVYGHYDVQPALKSDGWTFDPFTLHEHDGKLFGRGSTDDKVLSLLKFIL